MQEVPERRPLAIGAKLDIAAEESPEFRWQPVPGMSHL